MSLEHETMRRWEGHGFGVVKIVSCMHFGFEDPFAPIYGGVGYGLALTLMVMTGLQKDEVMGAETELDSDIQVEREKEQCEL